MNNVAPNSPFRFILLFTLLSFCHTLSATIISTAVTVDSYTVNYPEPDQAWRESQSGTQRASTSTRSTIYDTSVYAATEIFARNQGVAFLAAWKYQASAATGSAVISYQVENNASSARQFNLRFSPLFGFLTAYCADPDGQFDFDSGSSLACGSDDYATSGYNAQIWLNDELIWSSMASLRSDINGVSLKTDGAVLGNFDAQASTYGWDTQWFDLPLDVFQPSEQFNLRYSVDVLVDGRASLQGAVACEPFDCPYPDNVAFVEYGTPEFLEHSDQVFQFSSSALAVGEPENFGLIILGGIMLARLFGGRKPVDHAE
ncbi:hypothetical protein [Paraglaciecola sp. L1A13]|uniref:hypothetical protein n=1 Tax=Paraglaciecola sp. L1A13 TaxID=2686359 RepID=UPI00131D1D71|nr:hypothetical protein [Paraglaciecola sp. L1A13]